MAISMYKKAAKIKLRFDYRGQLSVEDLWDLPVEDLDVIYKGLRAVKREDSGDSLLKKETGKKGALDLRIELVEDIVSSKLAAVETAEKRAKKKERNQKILSILEAKQDQELNEMSAEELQNLVDEDGDEDDE